MDEIKETNKVEEIRSAIVEFFSKLAFVILHFVVITGWWFTAGYMERYPKVFFYDEPTYTDAIQSPPGKINHEYLDYMNELRNFALMETVTCTILTSLFTIILYLEWCRRSPKKE
jgi:hypothetical protein